MAQLALLWDDYRPHICQGLSSLQQNGELVDMTLAADGHHVKVHRLVISLVSPYLKEVLDSATNPHPIIFLNRVSYPVLCGILEYVYTGQAMVTRELLPELVQAAKELRIKGLHDVSLDVASQSNLKNITVPQTIDESETQQPNITNTQISDESSGKITKDVSIRNMPVISENDTVCETKTDNIMAIDTWDNFDTETDHSDTTGNDERAAKTEPSHKVRIRPNIIKDFWGRPGRKIIKSTGKKSKANCIFFKRAYTNQCTEQIPRKQGL